MDSNIVECLERLRLVDTYSRDVTAFNALLESLKGDGSNTIDWRELETARERSQRAWAALEAHIAEHRCLDLHWYDKTSRPPVNGALEAAAMAALDVILVADDDRRFVDANEAAAIAFNLPRNELVGRRVDEFFSEIRGEQVPDAWNSFIEDRVQSGICVLTASGGTRKFEYRAKANFAPGLHLGILREIRE